MTHLNGRSIIDTIKRLLPLDSLARELGLEPRRAGRDFRARCPFHDDKRPSLHLYQGDEPHYHCYVCGAHGDVITLFQKTHNLPFPEALDLLAARVGVARTNRRRTQTVAKNPIQVALDLYRSTPDDALLDPWQQDRKLESSVLEEAGVFASRAGTLLKVDEETLRVLADAGLVLRRRTASQDSQQDLPVSPYREFFLSSRIIFPLRDLSGEPVGLAGRSLDGKGPKYLYTPRLRTSRLLYAADRVEKRIERLDPSKEPVFDLFLVEGIVDVLRLEQLGFSAVALLGTSLSKRKVEIIQHLASMVEGRQGILAVHVFLDSDPAGMRGMADAVPKLLTAASSVTVFLVDVIQVDFPLDKPGEPSLEKTSRDPDSLLRNTDAEAALEALTEWTHPPAHALLAYFCEAHPNALDRRWRELSKPSRIQTLRQVERVFAAGGSDGSSGWQVICQRADPFTTGRGIASNSEAARQLQSFLNPQGPGVAPRTSPRIATSTSERVKLLRAVALAHASTQRREFPTDYGSWERLETGGTAFLDVLIQRLGHPGDNKPLLPLLAVLIPKADGRPRLKAIPSPEDLVLQQYMLSEILRDSIDGSKFSSRVPAVRYSRSARKHQVWTTGSGLGTENVVSFAYQVRMDVLSGAEPPGSEGMFRPYFECWRSFLRHIDKSVRRMGSERVHAIRLDIEGFYDNLSRAAVLEVLRPRVQEALDEANAEEYFDRAGLFQHGADSDNVDTATRAAEIVDWLLSQSFEYRYLDPGSGKPQDHAERGIPQGPDLSAYLANIALFPLDEAATRRLDSLKQSGDGQPQAVYARYVDDIVLVAKSANELRNLWELVEAELSKIDLRVNDKAEPLPSLSLTKFRHWLTSHRGGLGASGPLGEPNEEESLFRLGALADAGEVDRSQSLSILHSKDLESSSVGWTEISSKLDIAMSAKGLRFGEFVAASRGLWRGVAEQLHDSATPGEATEEFERMWQELVEHPHLTVSDEVQPQRDGTSEEPDNEAVQVQEDLFRHRPFLAACEGLERFLARRFDRAFQLDPAEQAAYQKWRHRLATWVSQGLLPLLVESLGLPAKPSALLAHMLDLRIRAVEWVAATIIGTDGAEAAKALDELPPNSSWAQRRFYISSCVAKGNRDGLDRACLSAADKFSLLHNAVSRLRISSVYQSDPMQPLVKTTTGLLDKVSYLEPWELTLIAIVRWGCIPRKFAIVMHS